MRADPRHDADAVVDSGEVAGDGDGDVNGGTSIFGNPKG